MESGGYSPRKKRSRRPDRTPKDTRLSELLSPESVRLLSATGLDLIRRIGFDVVRQILFDILTGRNLRDTTEVLTRRRVAALNLALLSLFLRGEERAPGFVKQLPDLAADMLATGHLDKSERWLALWLLGLTGKGVQNVLRDDATLYFEYRDRYVDACNEIIAYHEREYGQLAGTLNQGPDQAAAIDWRFMSYLLNAAGAQTLTIRGSDKSAYGKLFEKLVLGALLHVLGFSFEPREEPRAGVYWLSSTTTRESDATLIYELGKGVRFDIGFIGRGNPEIMLDKVGRFSRTEEIQGKRHFMATIVIVDRIPPRGSLRERADEIGGDIVQMSASYWPLDVASKLQNRLGYRSEILDFNETGTGGFEDYLKARLLDAPIEAFVRSLPAEDIMPQESDMSEQVDT